MRAYSLALLVFGLTAVGLAANPNRDDSSKKDKLDGTWEVVGIESAGESQGGEDVKNQGMVLTFKGDQYTFKTQIGADEDGTLKLDPKKSPKELDFEIKSGNDKGKTQKAIYEFDKDGTVKICFARPGADERPKELKTTADTEFTVFTLKRKAE